MYYFWEITIRPLKMSPAMNPRWPIGCTPINHCWKSTANTTTFKNAEATENSKNTVTATTDTDPSRVVGVATPCSWYAITPNAPERSTRVEKK